MDVQRLSGKYFIADPRRLELEKLVPVFQRWIQEHVVEGFLLDVADYRHVAEGPGVVLIGHEADRALDLSGGRAGFLYRRKRSMEGGLAERVGLAFRGGLLGCQAVENEKSLEGRVRFRTGEAEIAFLDRLRVPNDPAAFEALRAEIAAALGGLYPNQLLQVSRPEQDARGALRVRIAAPDT